MAARRSRIDTTPLFSAPDKCNVDIPNGRYAVFEGFCYSLISGLKMSMAGKSYRKVYASKDFLTE